jgi:hypothetical protein
VRSGLTVHRGGIARIHRDRLVAVVGRYLRYEDPQADERGDTHHNDQHPDRGIHAPEDVEELLYGVRAGLYAIPITHSRTVSPSATGARQPDSVGIAGYSQPQLGQRYCIGTAAGIFTLRLSPV